MLINACSLLWPESPRWLYAKNRQEEGVVMLLKIARWNGVDICQKKLVHLVEPMCTQSNNGDIGRNYFIVDQADLWTIVSLLL